MQIGRILVTASVALTATLTFAACDSNDSASPTTSVSEAPAPGAATVASKGRECTADDVKVGGKVGEAPTITIPDNCDAPKTLITKDLTAGTGEAAKAGQQLKMNYALVAWSTKQKVDSSFDRGQPFDLNLGAGQVIPGWDQGLVGIKQGGRRLLIIPPDLGYGAQGNSSVLPNETLVFVTDSTK